MSQAMMTLVQNSSRRSILKVLGAIGLVPAAAQATQALPLAAVITEFHAYLKQHDIRVVPNDRTGIMTYMAPTKGYQRTTLREMAAFEARLDQFDGGYDGWVRFQQDKWAAFEARLKKENDEEWRRKREEYWTEHGPEIERRIAERKAKRAAARKARAARKKAIAAAA